MGEVTTTIDRNADLTVRTVTGAVTAQDILDAMAAYQADEDGAGVAGGVRVRSNCERRTRDSNRAPFARSSPALHLGRVDPFSLPHTTDSRFGRDALAPFAACPRPRAEHGG